MRSSSTSSLGQRVARAATLAICLLSASAATAGGTWKESGRKDGIVTTLRDEPGRDFPTFRGNGVVNAPVYEIYAVLQDADRHKEWMHNCADSKMLKRKTDTSAIIYNRTDAPWPVHDRDVVLASSAKIIEPEKELRITFKVTQYNHPTPEDVVRMPVLEGHWHLKALTATTTEVEYQVNADPAGSIPDWLVKRTSREIPLHSIQGLRSQVKSTQGQYTTWLSNFRAKQAAAAPAPAAAPAAAAPPAP